MSIPQIKTILYATDLGKKMRPAFRHAISIAHQYEARIFMLHVAEPLGSTGMAVLDLYAPEKVDFENLELREILDQMEARLEKFGAEELGDDMHLISRVAAVTGQPAEEINRYAMEKEVDLIVVGSHTSDSFGAAFVGSTASKLINIADRPVLVVPLKKTKK